MLADDVGDLLAQQEGVLDRVAADVEVAVDHADVLVRVGLILDEERRRLGRGEDLEDLDVDLNGAGVALLVLVGTLHDGTRDRDAELAA